MPIPDFQVWVSVPAAWPTGMVRTVWPRSSSTSISKEIYRLLGMSGYARLDYRVTEDGEAYLLEANPNPQIAKDEDFALSAKHVGMAYPELIEQLIRFGINYVPDRIIG